VTGLDASQGGWRKQEEGIMARGTARAALVTALTEEPAKFTAGLTEARKVVIRARRGRRNWGEDRVNEFFAAHRLPEYTRHAHGFKTVKAPLVLRQFDDAHYTDEGLQALYDRTVGRYPARRAALRKDALGLYEQGLFSEEQLQEFLAAIGAEPAKHAVKVHVESVTVTSDASEEAARADVEKAIQAALGGTGVEVGTFTDTVLV
jgi:hypothetical protein